MINQLKSIGMRKASPSVRSGYAEGPGRRRARGACLPDQQTSSSAAVQHGHTLGAAGGAGVSEGISRIAAPDAYPVDGRGVAYSMAFFSAKHLGEGQYYLMTIVDKAGQPLDGGDLSPEVPTNARSGCTVRNRLRSRNACADPRLAWSSRSSHTPGLRRSRSSVESTSAEGADGKDSNWSRRILAASSKAVPCTDRKTVFDKGSCRHQITRGPPQAIRDGAAATPS